MQKNDGYFYCDVCKNRANTVYMAHMPYLQSLPNATVNVFPGVPISLPSNMIEMHDYDLCEDCANKIGTFLKKESQDNGCSVF